MQAHEDRSMSSSQVLSRIPWEDEDTPFDTGKESKNEFAELFANTEVSDEVKEGMIVSGRVVRLTPDSVIIDIGHKAEGEVSKQEFMRHGTELGVKVGDSVEVFIDSFEDNDGEMVLSYERALALRAWDRISDAHEKDEVVEVLLFQESRVV